MLIMRRVRRDEEGSIIMAMMITLVVTLLVAVALRTVTSAQTSSRVDQDRTNAFQYANAGIDQALYRLDRAELPTTTSGNYTPTVVNGEVTAFSDSITVGGSRFDVTAQQSPAGQSTYWKVRAVGTDPSGRQRAAIATISARPLFDNGFLTLTNFYLTGNQTTPVAYRSSTCPTAAPSCNVTPVPAFLATNGVFDGATQTIRHFAENWQGFNMYGKATADEADVACGNRRCTGEGGTVNNFTDAYLVAMPPEPPVATCPNGGNITGVIQPGNYVCNQPVNITGTVTVGSGGNGTGIVRLWVNESFSAAAGSVVNAAKEPWRFRVFQPTKPDGSQWSGSVCDANLWALLYTPGLRIDCPGSHQPEIFGAVVAYYHGGTGNQFDFHFDLDSAAKENDGIYVVENWRECPVGQTDC